MIGRVVLMDVRGGNELMEVDGGLYFGCDCGVLIIVYVCICIASSTCLHSRLTLQAVCLLNKKIIYKMENKNPMVEDIIICTRKPSISSSWW